jgi:hypothetical protein
MVAVLEIVVIGDLNVGNYDDYASLEAETLRVKSSLLYADKITLESPKLQLLLTRYVLRARLLATLAKEREEFGREILEQAASFLEDDSSKAPYKKEVIEGLRISGRAFSFLATEDLAEKMRKIDRASIDSGLLQGLFQDWGKLALEYRLQAPGNKYPPESAKAFNDLIKMSKAGLLQVNIEALWEMLSAEFENPEEAVGPAIDSINQSLARSEPARHLLFSSIERLRLSPEVTTEDIFEDAFSNRAALAGNLVASLPSFPEADVDEILDLRSRLSSRISRFRKSIIELESELNKDLVGNDFSAAVVELRLRHVDPALEELREAVRDEGALPALTRAVPTLSASALALGAACAVGAPTLASVAAVLAGVSTAMAREIIARRSIEKDLKQNKLFFLFDAERFLKR